VEARNLSDQSAEAHLILTLDGKQVAAEQLHLVADAPWRKVVDVKSAAGGHLVAQLGPSDTFPADNQVVAQVPPLMMHQVAMGSEASPFLRSLLAANPRVKIVTTEKSDGHDSGKIIRVMDEDLPSRLPAGPLLIVNPAGRCDLWRQGDPVADPLVVGQDDTSPVLAGLRLVDSYLPEARRLVLTEKAGAVAPLLWATDGTPLACAIDRPEGCVVVVGGSLEMSSLAGTPALDQFVANALDWLTPHAQSHAQNDGRERPSYNRDGLGSPSYVDLRTPELGVDVASVPARPAMPQPWLYLAALALLLFVAEWCLYQRRWIS
jgi:hypothetical protein